MTSTLASDVATALPSVELVATLVEVDGALAGFEEQLAVVGAWERVISWATARQAEMLVAIDQDDDIADYGWHAADAARSLADQLGLVLGVSGGSAQRRVNTAATWVTKLPAVHEALRVGAITTHHARLAASGAAVLDEQVAQQVGAAVMVDEGWRTPSQFAEVFARIVHELDAEGAELRNRRARKERRVSMRPQPNGMGSLWALLPAEDAQAVYQRVDEHARTSMATNTPGDDRTLEERRADALRDLVCGRRPDDNRADSGNDSAGGSAGGSSGGSSGGSGDDSGSPDDGQDPSAARPPTYGRYPRVDVVVSWSTLIGLDNAPGYLAGYGTIDAATARRICADPTATWHRLLTDPVSGRLLDYGRTVYRPPQDLRDHVVARDRTCIFVTCDRPAQCCDLDHHDDWADGGTTCEQCLHSLCRRHHKLRHDGGWSYSRDPDTGDIWWVDPHGGIWIRPAVVLPTPEPVEPPTPAEPATPVDSAAPATPAADNDPVDPPF